MKLADSLGPVLGGRDVAEKIRLQIEGEVAAGENVEIDLEGVIAVSPSFADELFGKMPSEVASHVEFRNVSDHLRSVAEMARAGRPEGSNGA
ncbi:MAG TPA: STAS-like domain-containing protein [Solirubrobacterales bacterium]|jgi:hypothetical protein|nr:STAS-like domain-containing protein [Solirubrobacterales bacterium]